MSNFLSRATDASEDEDPPAIEANEQGLGAHAYDSFVFSNSENQTGLSQYPSTDPFSMQQNYQSSHHPVQNPYHPVQTRLLPHESAPPWLSTVQAASSVPHMPMTPAVGTVPHHPSSFMAMRLQQHSETLPTPEASVAHHVSTMPPSQLQFAQRDNSDPFLARLPTLSPNPQHVNHLELTTAAMQFSALQASRRLYEVDFAVNSGVGYGGNYGTNIPMSSTSAASFFPGASSVTTDLESYWQQMEASGNPLTNFNQQHAAGWPNPMEPDSPQNLVSEMVYHETMTSRPQQGVLLRQNPFELGHSLASNEDRVELPSSLRNNMSEEMSTPTLARRASYPYHSHEKPPGFGTLAKRLREKLKGKPKRPLTAYNIFFKDERAAILEEIADREQPVEVEESGLDGNVNFWSDWQVKPSPTAAASNVMDNSDPATRGRLSASSVGETTSDETKKQRRKQPHGKIGFEKMAKVISERWKTVDPARRADCERRAREDTIRYKAELAIYMEKHREALRVTQEELESSVSQQTRERYLGRLPRSYSTQERSPSSSPSRQLKKQGDEGESK